jgi:hypothetical protein
MLVIWAKIAIHRSSKLHFVGLGTYAVPVGFEIACPRHDIGISIQPCYNVVNCRAIYILI